MRATSYVTRGTLLVLLCAFGVWMVQRHDSSIAGAKRAPNQENQTVRPAAGRVRSPALDTLRRPYGSSDVAFEPNRGQVDPAVKFLARGGGYSLYLTATGATLSFAPHGRQGQAVSDGAIATKGRPAETTSVPDVVRMSFAGANPNPEVAGKDQLPGRVNYLVGSDAQRWHTDIPTYSRISYRSLYQGIDLAYYGTHGQVEYDFIVQPAADPGLIRLKYDGMKAVRLNPDGDLVLSFGRREITQKKPLIYQEDRGRREQIPGKYKMLARNEIGLEVGPYDTARPLVIDPALVYLSVFGSPTGGEQSAAMATDANGNIYITGTAFAPDFPTTLGAFQTSGQGGLNEIFVSKLSADGTQLLYSTYLGGHNGSADDDGLAIAVDSLGQAYVGGNTSGLDFPTTAGGFQTQAGSCPNTGSYCDGFLTELNASGTGLVYSTFVGGTDADRVHGVALDSNGNVYLTGQTVSTDFPTTPGAYLTSIPPTLHSHRWAFITKIDPRKTGSASLVYSTYVGGIGVDATGIAVDATGNTYIVGSGASPGDYPTTPGAFQTSTSASASGAAFVTKMNPTGSALVYSTFLGSGGPTAVAIDPDGNAYVTGGTSAADFPTTSGAFQPTLAGVNAAFISKLNPSGSALVYSTFIGGAMPAGFVDATVSNSIAIDSARNAYIVGTTDSDDFPTSSVTLEAVCGRGTCQSQPQPCPSGGEDCPRNAPNAFVTELNPAGSALVFSTFFGVGGNGSALALNAASGDIVVTGRGGGLPATAGAFSSPNGASFVARISPGALGAAVALAPGLVTFPTEPIGTSTQQTATLTSRGNAPLAIGGISLTGSAYSQTNDCPTTLPPLTTCTFTISFTPTQETAFNGQLMVADNALGSPHMIFLGGSGGTALLTLSTSSLTFPSGVLNAPSTPQSITLMNNGTAQIQLTSITTTGDFSQTNTCLGSPLAIGKSCTISVVFTPTAMGSRTGTITLVDNAPNSPQTVALGGTGTDFSVSPASSSATVNAGQSASYTLNVSSLGSFNQAVSLACAGAPRGATCTVSPSSVTPTGTSATSATVTVATTARSLLIPVQWISFREPLVLPVALIFTMLLLFLLTTRFERRGRKVGVVFCLMAVVLVGAVAGCGGSSSSAGPGPGSNNGTPAGTYSLTVTATVGTATRTTTLQLIVN
jgi:hypothetical protein